ncbi:MAG: phosphoribosylformimino-5-aminoimidazole carboxamide ribotide isomerase [Lentisphaeria bacterium]|nr:phosphoribosylformimino-5-aminoimidazole carboxamide ribotide isomerase [Lentisphaeria bacterium]
MRFRPCIDLHDGKVKQIVGSTLSDSGGLETNFVAENDSDYFAELYRKYNLPGGHVIMLGKGNETAAKKALNAYPGGLQVGGGLNDCNGREFLDAGASHLIFTSYIVADGVLHFDRLKKLVAVYGRERIVLDLSCRKKDDGKYYVVSNRWQTFTDVEVNLSTLDMLSEYADEFLIHAVDVEGKQCGIDEELLSIIGKHDNIAVSYAGGIKSFSDIEKIDVAGNGRIDFTIGSALDIFGGPLSFKEVVEFTERRLR